MAAAKPQEPQGPTVYQAIVPLVVAKDATGRDTYVYSGQIVPGHVAESEVERLLEGSFIAALESPEPAAASE